MSRLTLKHKVRKQYDQRAIQEVVEELENQVNRLSEGRQFAYHTSATSAPTGGDWVLGDWVKNSEPSAGGYFGWVCVTSGTPGTWKGFGVIQA